MHTTETQPLISVTETARRLGVSRATAYRRVREGEIPAFRVGRNRKAPLRVDPIELDAWLRSEPGERA